MGSINALTYPHFLADVTSGVRLRQPEPQYFFAMAAMAGRLRLESIDAGAATVQQYVSALSGGAPVPPDLDRLIRFADEGMGGIFQTVTEIGKTNDGDTVKFKRPIFDGAGYTEADRKVTPDKATSTTGLVVRAEEVPITLAQFEGPYGASGTAVQPFAIANFDARYRANPFSLVGEVSLQLRRDYVKWLDTVLRDRLRGSRYTTLPSGISAASSFVSGGTAYASLEQIIDAKKSLTDREWRPFPNGRYVCLVPSTFQKQMISDPDWVVLSANQLEKNMLYRQIASVQDIDFFEVTTLKSYVATDSVYCGGTSTAVATATTVASGVTLSEALLIGPEAVGFAPGEDPATFFADDTDYGKYAKVIWRAVHGFGLLDERGIQRIIYQA